MAAIFMVTVVKVIDNSPEDYTNVRCWGWYNKFEDAEKAVIENHTDIFENNWHNTAVIEEVEEGVGSNATIKQWYKASYTQSLDPIVERIKQPIDGYFNWWAG